MALGIIGCTSCRVKIQSQPSLYLEQGAHHVISFITSSSKARDGAQCFLQLVDFWIHFPRLLRKSISHLGVIRPTDSCHPVQWKCVELNCWMSDAGDFIYALVWRIIFEEIGIPYTDMDENWGDLTECFLGIGLGTYPMDDPVAFPMNIYYAAMLLENLVQDL